MDGPNLGIWKNIHSPDLIGWAWNGEIKIKILVDE
jgi:hypothetical protein